MKKESLKEKLKLIETLVGECLVELDGKETSTQPVKTSAEESKSTEDIGLQIANKICDCDEYELLEKKIIDTEDKEAKILMCFYISKKYFENQWLTSGNVEKITSEIGIKITVSNASKLLKKMRAYLECGESRKKGVPTKYRLNRNGLKKVEEILHE